MKIKLTLLVIVFVSLFALAGSQSVSAASLTKEQCSRKILGIPTWFNGLVKVENNKCEIVSPSEMDTFDSTGKSNGDGLSRFIWHVVLNVIDIVLRLIAWIAAGMMIFGGFKLITSDGAADKAAQGRKTILNAAIGLVIAIGSVGLVNLVMGII